MITGGVVIADDPEFAQRRDLSPDAQGAQYHRHRHRHAPQQRKFAERAWRERKPLPISISIGTHPYELVAATFKAT